MVNQQTGEILSDMDDAELVDYISYTDMNMRSARDAADRAKAEGIRRAVERGATTIYGDSVNFVVTTPNDYDRTQLVPLKEHFTPEEWNECFWTETVEKSSMTKVKKHGRAHGKTCLDIIERATFPGKITGKLEIK